MTEAPLPLPLKALQAFEATARLGAIGRAAGELGVTHGAVSRQIGALQARLGLRLFDGPRNARRLTEAGLRLNEEIAPAFAMLKAAAARRAPQRTRLRLSCLSTLAARWLIPRLPRLPDGLQVELAESYGPLDRTLDGASLAIRMLTPGQPVPAGLAAHPFMANPVGLVLAPGREAGRARRLVSRSHPSAWDDWVAAGGHAPPAAAAPLAFDHQQTLIEAAIAGLGACVTQRPLVEADLAAGRLTAPHGFFDNGAVFAVFHAEGQASAPARRLIRWLQVEGASSAPLG